MARSDVLNLEELFGARERPKVKIKTDGPTYELRLPDELDPIEQIELSKRSAQLGELYASVDMGMPSDAQRGATEQLILLLRSQLGILNNDLADEPLGFTAMMRILEFYREQVEPEAAETESAAPKE
mgnify:CR=1 FL=1